jgi:arylsulfatase A-like enzyme
MGIEGETLLVLFSDHGEEFFEHGYLGHGGTLHQQGLHVPVILKRRGKLKSGKRIPGVAGLIDLGPTLVELAGIPSKFETNSSSSLAEVALNDQPRENVRPVVSERFLAKDACAQQQQSRPSTMCVPMEVAIRDGEHSFIYDQSTGVARLYNVLSDPREQRDIASTSKKKVDGYRRKVATLPKLDDNGQPPTENPPEIPSELEENLRALGYIE